MVSSTSGVTATKLIDKLCDGKIVTREDIDEVYHRKLQCSKDDLYEACQGIITDHHIFLLQAIKRDIESTESIISELSSRIKESLSEYENATEAEGHTRFKYKNRRRFNSGDRLGYVCFPH
ncbi:MAG: hypothetical protein ABFC28_03835 [Rikenellaceae bacterium]